MISQIINFTEFLFLKNFKTIFNTQEFYSFIKRAYIATKKDYEYHYESNENKLIELIISNTGWLTVYLYRLGNEVYKVNGEHKILNELHFVQKHICGSEVYYSVDIGIGFYVRHGIGTVIGSRCEIGKGLVIHQGCTIGHKFKLGNGPKIGNDVELGAGAKVLGDISIGNNVIIGANSVVINSLLSDSIVGGIPAKYLKKI